MPELSTEEQAIYSLIENNTRITQLQISKHEKWLGCYERHEGHLNIDKQQSTLRHIRKIVRDMRINKNMPILSDRLGYFIMRTSTEAEEYIKRLEITAKSQAKSWFETYRSMSKLFNVESKYLEKLASPNERKIKVREHTRKIKKEETTSTKDQGSLF